MRQKLLLALATAVPAVFGEHGSLKDIDHVVLFMQENRAFDHYYGTVAGVRGFKDPNVAMLDNGKPMWYQPTPKNVSAEYLLPWYLSEDKKYKDSNQCSLGGSNEWTPNHNAWNFGAVDGWVTKQNAHAWGHYRRSDIPTHYDIVEGWTVADMYAESVMGPTCPNRVTWVSGTINVNGEQGDFHKVGGPYIENMETPGCENNNGTEYACYPLGWKTFPEHLEDNDVDWYVFQDKDNFDDNPLAYFSQYQKDDKTDPLIIKGNSFTGLQNFYDRAANGTLPPVSYIIGPMELSEHPPNRPVDGAWLQKKIVDAVVKSPKYKNTALIISYDETGGYADHVTPFVSPKDAGEWLMDPTVDQDERKYVPTGPGFRVPLYVVSPWTRGGRVYTAPTDHNSQTKFVQRWLKERFGKDIKVPEMQPWRQKNMDDLVDMFDFANPDYSVPNIADVNEPKKRGDKWVGPADCQAKYKDRLAPVPYNKQSASNSLWTEEGYKQVLGALTEGRYLVFSNNGKCLESKDSKLSAAKCSQGYSNQDQWFIAHQQGNVFSKSFKLQAANGAGYLKGSGFTDHGDDADTVTIAYSSDGYELSSNQGFLSASGSYQKSAEHFKVYSVTYN